MTRKKLSGSYYTPGFLADFVVDYLSHYLILNDNIDILEPSVGDGVFIKSLNNNLFQKTDKTISITSIEKYKKELEKAVVESRSNRSKNIHFTFYKNDFLKIQKELNKKFSYILGNPPYIKRRFLNKTQIELGKEIHKNADLPESAFKNIWSAFLIRCSELLTENGILAFVLPSELLQVKFSQVIRSYLLTNFERIEIFTFDELLFEQLGQDTILLICFKQHIDKGQYFARIKDQSQLKQKSFSLSSQFKISDSSIKWTNHILNSDEIELMDKIKKSLNSINFYCESKPGIVTAANDYFIIDRELEKQYDLKSYTTPIIKKGFFVNGSVVFDKNDFRHLVLSARPSKLINLNNVSSGELSVKSKDYLQIGKDQNIHKRYKCSIRDKWYKIPNIGNPSDGFFFKRCHFYPKLLVNEAKVLVTDSAYKIDMRDNYSIQDLVFSFYNSLTLAFAEMDGRYYGGGVLELTPNEFKSLPLPYTSISLNEFNTFRNSFEKKDVIIDVLNKFDNDILTSVLKISEETVIRIQKIYKKLIDKRFRRN